MSKIKIAEYISELLIYHIVPCWIFFGIFNILLFYILLKIEKEDVVTIFKEEVDLKPLVTSAVLGPISIFLLLKDYRKMCIREREEIRQTCSWWELKEYGGKY